MAPTVAVAHYPEGAGHATRMVAIAEAIESAGGSVRMAGGGAGTEFVRLNGYDEFEPTTVDYIDTYQGGSLWQAARRSLPASMSRIADYQAWLSATDPDALVTDDMFAAMAATRCDVPLYVLKHDMPGLYDDFTERNGARFHTLFQLSAARDFFYPVVWPESRGDPERATRIPPVALDGEATVERDVDVVVVPSHYSSLSRIADHLRRQGYDVLDVADEEWDPVESLLPYVRAADVVVCSGYSSIMDAAVAGTPCVVHPATDEQDAVAGWLERFDVTGFAVAPEPMDVLDAVAAPPPAPEFENGAEFVARRVLVDLADPDPYAAGADGFDDDSDVVDGSRRSVAAVPALVAACLVTTGSLVGPSGVSRAVGTVGGRLRSVVRGAAGCAAGAARRSGGRAAAAARGAGGRVAGLGGAVAGAAAGVASAAAGGCADGLRRCRRAATDVGRPL